MARKEQLAGVAAAAALALMAVLYLAVPPGHGRSAPHGVPLAVLVMAAVLTASLAVAHRILSGLLAAIAGLLASGPRGVAHEVVWLRKAGFIVGIGYALYLTLQQAHAQRENRFGALEQERRDKGLD